MILKEISIDPSIMQTLCQNFCQFSISPLICSPIRPRLVFVVSNSVGACYIECAQGMQSLKYRNCQCLPSPILLQFEFGAVPPGCAFGDRTTMKLPEMKVAFYPIRAVYLL